MFCEKCGTQIPEGAIACPACGNAITNPAQPQAEPQVQAEPQPQPQPQAEPQAQYQQPQYGQPQYQQTPPQYQQAPPQYQQAPPQYQQAPPQYQQVPPQTPPAYRDLDTAKTLGIVAIVMAFLFPVVCWICGGIGISKANDIIGMAEMNNDAYMIEAGKSAKKTNKIGIIIGIVLTAVSVLLTILLMLIPIIVAGASQ